MRKTLFEMNLTIVGNSTFIHPMDKEEMIKFLVDKILEAEVLMRHKYGDSSLMIGPKIEEKT